MACIRILSRGRIFLGGEATLAPKKRYLHGALHDMSSLPRAFYGRLFSCHGKSAKVDFNDTNLGR